MFFVRTTNTCRPTNIIALQYELDIYSRFQHSLEGGGGAAPKLAICEARSYFLGTDDDGTSRSLCIIILKYFSCVLNRFFLT